MDFILDCISLLYVVHFKFHNYIEFLIIKGQYKSNFYEFINEYHFN